LIDLFETSAPKSIADMKRALDHQSPRDLAFAAHTLKGSCGNLGKFPLYEACVRIELAARDNSLENMPALVADAEKKLAEMITTLKSLPPKSSQKQ
jgi:HPt (histidine-containing phosphotransfer) domain-containing protein